MGRRYDTLEASQLRSFAQDDDLELKSALAACDLYSYAHRPSYPRLFRRLTDRQRHHD